MTLRPPRLRNKFPLGAVALAASLVMAGCAPKGQSLKFSSTDGRRVFTHAFPEAYVSPGSEGDFDIFLVEDGVSLAEQASSSRKPLQAAPDTPRQIVHVRIVWKPMKGTSPDQPAATNAIINWYVLGTGGANESTNLLRYTGSGFVKVDLNSKRAVVDVHDVQLVLKEQRGNLSDPLGPATLSGQFRANISDSHVKALLAEVHDVTTRPLTSADAGR